MSARGLVTALVAVALGAALSAAPALGEDLAARADLTLARDESASGSDQFVRQAYQLSYHHRFSEPIGYGLQLRYQEDRGASHFAGTTSPLLSRLASPSATLSWLIPEGRLQLAWDLNWGSELDPTTGAFDDRSLQRLQGSGAWRPWKAVELGVHADRSSSTATSAGLETTDQQAGLTADYKGSELRARLEARTTRYDDARSQLSRTGQGLRATLDYGRALGAQASAGLRYVADYNVNRDAAASASATIPVLQTPVAGLFVQTDLPIDTSTTPMVSLAALIDRNLTAPVGVPLGPDGASFQNLGVDLGRFLTVDELQLHVRGAAGTPVPFGGPIGWTVYSSVDGVTWAPVDGAGVSYSAALSAYLVTFPPITTRYVKAVNFGVNTVQTDLTELQAYGHEKPTRSSTLLQTVGLTAAWQPLERLAISYTGQANLGDFSPAGQATLRSQDLANQLSALIGPFGPVSVQLSESQQASSQVGVASQGSLATGISLRYDPFPRLGATAEARRAETWVGEVRAWSTGINLGSRAVLLDTLRASLTGGLARQQIASGGSSDYLSATGAVSARPLELLDVNLLLSAQRTYASAGDLSAQTSTPQLRIAQYQRYQLEAVLHPGEQAALSARLNWTSTPTQSGLAQSFSFNWNPFPGGAVLLAFDYNEEIDPLSGQHFRRASATPRWTVNRHAYLELAYNYVRATGQSDSRSQNLYLTLSVNL